MAKQELRVSSSTKPNSAAGAIAGYAADGHTVTVVAIGTRAVSQMMKAATIATGLAIMRGWRLLYHPTFADEEVDDRSGTITAIRLHVHASRVGDSLEEGSGG